MQRVGAVLLVVAAFLPGTVAAVEVVAAVQQTSEYTSNTLRTETDEIGEWVHMPGVDFRAAQDSAALEMDIDYSYIRRFYTKDYWQDENRLIGTAAIDWHALPDRLDLFVNNSRTESTERARQATTQANRQVVSTTDAGGRLRFQPRSADELQLEYLFRDIHTTRTATDSQRHNGTARYLVGLSENRGLTLLGTYSDITYEGAFPNAEYAIGTIGYAQATGPVDFELNVGYNWYDREDRGSTSDPTYNGSLSWQATSAVNLGITASHVITDQSSSLADGGTATENTNINAAFKETMGQLNYSHLLGANTLSVSGYWARQEYAEDVPLTNTRIGARANFSRSLTRTTNFELFADFSNRDYEDTGIIDGEFVPRDDQDELRAGFRMDHRLGRSLSFNWGVRYEKREAVTTRSYDEWLGRLQIYWTFLGASRAGS